MPYQPLVAEVRCRCTPVYVDMDGRLYAGHEIIKTLKIELSNTSATVHSSANLCKTKTSGFGYTRPPFGCNSTDSSTDTAETMTPTPNTSEEKARNLSIFFSSPSSLRGLLAEILPGLSPSARTMISLSPLTLLPLGITLDVANGRDLSRATAANAGGFGAGYLASKLIGALMKHPDAVRFAARMGMQGARGNVAGALIGFIAGFVGYSLASDLIYEMPDLPDSSDWGHYGYDDWLFIPSP